MKKTMTMGVMLIALTAAFSCTETETGIDPEPDNDDQVALGVATNLKVDAGTRATTKSVVSGDMITYTDYAKAPGLGVLVTNSNADGWYTPDGGADWHHVWYMGDERGANWISIKEKGVTYDETKKKEEPYYLTKTVGKVYAYYPYDAAVTSSLQSISGESALKIPVTVLSSGTIDASLANNAKKYWNISTWATNRNTDASLSLSTEKDYLYFDGTDGGRYVNNGRADGKTPVTPDDDPNNTDADNPGYKINLYMKHALAMVSFRVYDGGHLSDNDVNFTKFEIKNHNSGSSPFKTGSGKMALTDGAITETSSTSGMSRAIDNYILMRQIEAGGEEGEHAFISPESSSSQINGRTVSKAVSALVYPITNIGENDIDVEITLKEGGKSAVVYTVTLPGGTTWEAGNNHIYTFMAGRNKLEIVDVTVEKWNQIEEDEITL